MHVLSMMNSEIDGPPADPERLQHLQLFTKSFTRYEATDLLIECAVPHPCPSSHPDLSCHEEP